MYGPLRPAAASTALTSFLVSVVVGKDRRSMPTGHGKQTTAAAGVPPDSKGTNRTSIAVAGISPAAWRSAPSTAASSRHWRKSPQMFSLAATVSRPGTTEPHTAHQQCPTEVTIYYRFHPRRTHSLPVVRLYELNGEAYYVVRRADGRPLAVPRLDGPPGATPENFPPPCRFACCLSYAASP